MVLDTKIAAVREHFGIKNLEDWNRIAPADVLAIDGVGPVTLDTIRLYLAGRNCTLKDDGTATYWFQHLSQARIGSEMADGENGIVSSFGIVVDGRERTPYRFMGLTKTNSKGERVPLLTNVEFGRLETGDYSVRGMEQLVAVERKSLADLYSTLGHDRDRFEREHERLAGMHSACVVVEADWDTVMNHPPERSQLNPKSIMGTYLSWYQRYGVAWNMLPGVRASELFTYKFLDMFYRGRNTPPKEE